MTEKRFLALCILWQRDTSIHSATHMICSGEAYEELKAAGQEIVPFLLELLKYNIWMGYQYLLGELTQEDIWVGDSSVEGWRQINVAESAKKWIEWGQKKGLIQ